MRAKQGTAEKQDKENAGDLSWLDQPREKSIVGYDPLQAYLVEIGRYSLLSREEEHELSIRYQEHNDNEAGERLVTANLRLVVKIAMEFQRYWAQSLTDLIQEGNLGLLHAVRKFDPYKGVKFSYYAAFWIRAYILKFIMANHKLVKVGTTQHQRRLFFKLGAERQKLLSEGLEPEPKLLAERLGVKKQELVEMSQRMGSHDLSLDAPLTPESKANIGDFMPDDRVDVEDSIQKAQHRRMFQNNLRAFRNRLSGRDAEIFDRRIIAEKPLTLQTLGDKYHISRERVRQIESKLVKRVENWMEENIPDFEEEFAEAPVGGEIWSEGVSARLHLF
jgi:RNA polymerase sigma-32 factor